MSTASDEIEYRTNTLIEVPENFYHPLSLATGFLKAAFPMEGLNITASEEEAIGQGPSKRAFPAPDLLSPLSEARRTSAVVTPSYNEYGRMVQIAVIQ